MTTVADLKERVPNDTELGITKSFRDVVVADTGDRLSVGDHEYYLDEEGHETLSKAVGIPANFLSKGENDSIRYAVYDHYFDSLRERNVSFTFQGNEGERDLLIGAYPADKIFIPRNRVLDEVIGRIFQPKDEVKRLDTFGGALSLDIITKRREVQPRVGDYTAGGLRFITYASPSVARRAPSIGLFAERYSCENGMTYTFEGGGKGFLDDAQDVDDVLRIMEEVAGEAMDAVTPWLEGFSATTEVEIENPASFIRRVGQDAGLPARLILELEEESAALEQHTKYDVLNLITESQHKQGVTRSVREKLMAIGGELATENSRHCVNCGAKVGQVHRH